ncbi:protein FAM186A [Sarcophilus harrisii]|uniref:protein FAM186A n=1 Tax=Sarcophilus harrisii TaxID=9305 RepID=UPI001301ED9C|nr:protein FAM186A [Sarcophilus harrisii]
MYSKIHNPKKSPESEIEPEKSTEITQEGMEMPDSVKTVLLKLEDSELNRDKEDLRMQFDNIMLQVNEIINRYQGDSERSEFKKRKLFPTDKDFQKCRTKTLDLIYQCMQSADVKERILRELLAWLEQWHVTLSETTISEEDENDYYSCIEDMEALPNALNTTQLNINSLIAFGMYFLKDKKRYKKKLASKGTMWKAWRTKFLQKPEAGVPLKPEQMIKEDAITNIKVSEILDMLQELMDSKMFNKSEINVIKYISSTTANLHKALAFQNQELKNLVLQCTSMGEEIKEYYGLEKQSLQQAIQILSNKNERLEMELTNREEKYSRLLQHQGKLERQLKWLKAVAVLPMQEMMKKKKKMLLRAQEKTKQHFEEQSEESSSSEESFQMEVPSFPESLEEPSREPSDSRKLEKGPSITWEQSPTRGELPSDSKHSLVPMAPVSSEKALRFSGDTPEDYSGAPFPESIIPTQETREEYKLLTDISNMGRRPEPYMHKEIQPTLEDEVQSVASLGERKEPMESELAAEDWDGEFDEGSKSEWSTKLETIRKEWRQKEKALREAPQNELQDFQHALMSFLQQKIDSLEKSDSKSQLKELEEPKTPQVQRSLQQVREKMEEYFEKLVAILTNTLKKYKRKKPEKSGEPKGKKGLPHSTNVLSETSDPTLASLLKVFLPQGQPPKEGGGKKGGKGPRRRQKDKEDYLDFDLTKAQSLSKEQGLKFIKQLQEERRLWKETQEEIQHKLQEENAWFERQDEKLKWEMKQRQWQAEEDLWTEMQQQWSKQEKEYDKKRKQWALDAVHHKMLDIKELERWKERIAQKYQKQVEIQMQILRKQEEELQKLFPDKFNEWRRIKLQRDKKQHIERLLQQWRPEMQQEQEQELGELLSEVTPGYPTASERRAFSLPVAPGAIKKSWSFAVPEEPPALIPPLAPATPGQTPVSQSLGAPGQPLPSMIPEIPSELETLLGPAAPEEAPGSWVTPGSEPPQKLQVPVPPEKPQMPWVPLVSGQPQTLQDFPTTEQSKMSWAPAVSGHPQTSWSPGQPQISQTTEGPQHVSATPVAGGQPQITREPGQFQASWDSREPFPPPPPPVTLAAPGETPTPVTLAAPGEIPIPVTFAVPGKPPPPVTLAAPGEIPTTPVTLAAPGEIPTPVTFAVPGKPPPPVTLAAPGEIPTPVTFAAPGKPPPPVTFAAPGEIPTCDPSSIPVTFAVPGEIPTPVTFAAPGKPPPTVTLAAPGEIPTPVTFAVPGKSPQPVTLAAPGEIPTPVTFAVPGKLPIPVTFAVPGKPPPPVTLAAPGETPTPVTLAAPGKPPIPVTFAAPGEPPIPVTFAAPGEAPIPVTLAAPGEIPTPMTFAVPGKPPIPVTFAAPGKPPPPVTFAVPGEPPPPVTFAVPEEPPTSVTLAPPGQPLTPMAFAAPGEFPIPMTFAVPGEPPLPVTFAPPKEPLTPVTFAAPGEPPPSLTFAIPREPPTQVKLAVPRELPTPLTFAAPREPLTPVTFTAPREPPIILTAAPGEIPTPVTPTAPEEPHTPLSFAASKETPRPMTFATPGKPLRHVIFAAPREPPLTEAFTAYRELPTDMTFAAPREPPPPVPFTPPRETPTAAPRELPTYVTFAEPMKPPISGTTVPLRPHPKRVTTAALRKPPTPVTFAVPGEAPTDVTFAIPREPPISVAFGAPKEPQRYVTFAAPREPPISVTFAVPQEPSPHVPFAAPREFPPPVAPAGPREPLTPVAFGAPKEPSRRVPFAAPREFPPAVAPAGPREPLTPVAFGAPREPSRHVPFAAPREFPPPVAPAGPREPLTPVAFGAPREPSRRVPFAAPRKFPPPMAPAVPREPLTPVAPAGPREPLTPVAFGAPREPSRRVPFAAPRKFPPPVAPAVPREPLSSVAFGAPREPLTSVPFGAPREFPPPVAPAGPREFPLPVGPGLLPTSEAPEASVSQFIPYPGQRLVSPGPQLLKPSNSFRQTLTTQPPSALEKLSPGLAPPPSLKPFLGGPPPKFEMPLFPPTPGKPSGILKKTQPYTLEEEIAYKALSPQPSLVAEYSFPVKFPKSPPPPSAQFLQISPLMTSAQIPPKVHLPSIESKRPTSPSFIVAGKSKMIVPPSSPRDFFVSVPPTEETRYFIDVEGQRKNLAILSQAKESFQLPLRLYNAAKELINETHYLNQMRLGYLFRKYIAYRLIQSARQNIINRIKAIRNSGKGQESQILHLFLNRIDAYQKKVMEAWTMKQMTLEQKRNKCSVKMIDLYDQIQKKYNLKLKSPIPLAIHKKEPKHPLKDVCFKHEVQWPFPMKMEKEEEFEILKKLEKQKDKVESLWRADLSTSSFPIEAKTPMKLLWDQVGGYPDIPRLLELDVHSTLSKSLASIRSR